MSSSSRDPTPSSPAREGRRAIDVDRAWYAGGGVVSNGIGLRRRLARLRGSTVVEDVAVYDKGVAEIARLEPGLRDLSDADLGARSHSLREEARAGRPLDEIQARAYALVREAARRALGQRPYDVQVTAALALHAGAVVEMQTGEGKTLAAVMPAYLNALTGRGVHVLTFND